MTQARMLERNRKRTTGAFIAAALTWAFCMGAAREVNAAGVVSLDDLPAVVARELTKKFEELRRGSLQELAENLAENPVKGEIVLLVDRGSSESVNQGDIESDLREALTTMTLRDAADLVSRAHGLPRRKVYQTALKLEKDGT